ncbi:MAG: alpha-glucosidase C-terminal domain-containing protein [Anaerolineae bacterium]|nr:alpha-glucosidase C-terminal domain-containing protein [Anaerolineae bacterium]
MLGLALMLSFSVVSSAEGERSSTDGMPWWNDRVFYEIFVRSFQDSDGDGVGDLQGVISKLDYLNDGDPNTNTDLGVTGIWLMPIMESPSYHGYDVTDYMKVEPDYGTNDDFKQLMAEAHKRGIAVIVDMVLNHTSRDHAWFKDAQTPGSTHDQWYRWSITKPAQIGPWGQQVWYSRGNRYYYAVFWDGMPDLNLRNPAVTQTLFDVARFWLEDLGADGFRMDAIRYLVEDGNTLASSEGNFTWLKKWNDYINSLDPQALTIGEVWTNSFEVSKYVPGDIDVAFEFDLARGILDAVNNGSSGALVPVLERAQRLYPAGQYASFVTNHDQNRLMTEVNEDVGRAQAAAAILLTTPGVPFLYYGEEIGMIGAKPDECIRTPMQWDASKPHAAFISGKRCSTNEADFNLAAQADDPASLFNLYRSFIHLRNANPALRVGTLSLVESDSMALLAFVRQSQEQNVLVVINLSAKPVSDYQLSLAASNLAEGASATLLWGEGSAAAPPIDSSGGFAAYTPLAEIPAHSAVIIQIDS